MVSKTRLERFYRKFNRRKYVSPDPLQFLYDYPEVRDREIAALIASSLAYGRVARILKSVDGVLRKMGPSPYAFLGKTSAGELNNIFRGFKHRFATGADLVSMLAGAKLMISKYGSLNECFLLGMKRTDDTVLPALRSFAAELRCKGNHLIPSPEKRSACKRLNLFLRWMVRKDAVDPGGWRGIHRSKLIVPLDTHMARIGRALGFTRRKSADIGMALEITRSFRKLAPEDPVRYDFALTRFGIRKELKAATLYDEICSGRPGAR